jgi:hypothetical protein
MCPRQTNELVIIRGLLKPICYVEYNNAPILSIRLPIKSGRTILGSE